MDREEIIAELLNTYRQEIDALTDPELLYHWRTTKAAKEITDQEWEAIAKKCALQHTTKNS